MEDLVAAAERVGAGEPPGPIRKPETVDLARLVEAFGTMSERVRERTELLEREREAAVSVLGSLTPAAVLFREPDGRVLFANPAADALLPPGALLSERLPSPRFEPVLAALGSPRPSRRGSRFQWPGARPSCESSWPTFPPTTRG